MLVFITALKSPKVSSSWEYVSKLFERSVKSICNQTCEDFQIVVVCHEKPKTEFHHPKINYIEVDFPIPTNDRLSKEADKAKKLLKGLAYAEKFSPSHIMIVDADDCVSKHIVKYVAQNPDSQGWFIKKGYVYKEGSKFIYFRHKEFSNICGSGIIIKYNLYPELFNKYFYDHKIIQIKDDIKLEPLPFNGAVYIGQHGENLFLTNSRHSESRSVRISKGYIYYLLYLSQYRLLTKKIRTEFGLFEIN